MSHVCSALPTRLQILVWTIRAMTLPACVPHRAQDHHLTRILSSLFLLCSMCSCQGVFPVSLPFESPNNSKKWIGQVLLFADINTFYDAYVREVNWLIQWQMAELGQGHHFPCLQLSVLPLFRSLLMESKGLNVSPKHKCWKFNAQCNCVEIRANEKSLGHEEWINANYKRAEIVSLISSSVFALPPLDDAEKKPLTRCWLLDLELPRFQTHETIHFCIL